MFLLYICLKSESALCDTSKTIMGQCSYMHGWLTLWTLWNLISWGYDQIEVCKPIYVSTVDLPAFTCCHISYIRRVRIHMLCNIKMYGETSNTVSLCLLSIWYPTLCNFPCSLESSTLNISSLNRWCSLMALISCVKHFCSHSFSENHKQQFWRPPSANWKCLYSFLWASCQYVNIQGKLFFRITSVIHFLVAIPDLLPNCITFIHYCNCCP